MKTSTINARITPELKHDVEGILAHLGLTLSEAVSLYFHQISLHKGLPFDVRIPNATTRKAMKAAAEGKTKRFATAADAFRALDA
jgi:DNA-damage-inducible protein J